MEIENARVVFITGVSKGSGESLALVLLERDDTRVIGIGRRDSPRLTHARYAFQACDLADTERLEAAVAPLFERVAGQGFGSVCLINNAAVATPVGLIGEVDFSESARAMAVNLTNPLGLCNLFCRIFAGRPGNRRIINISSGAAHMAVPGIGVYSIGKSGLEMLTRVIAEERRDTDFACIAVQPGILDTEMQASMRHYPPNQLPSAELFRRYRENNLLRSPESASREIVARFVLATVQNGRIYELSAR